METFECEKNYVRDYVKSLLFRAGSNYREVVDVNAASYEVSPGALAPGDANFLTPGDNGLFDQTVAQPTFDNLNTLLVGSITVAISAEADTDFGWIGVFNQTIGSGTETWLLKEPGPNLRALNVPFCVLGGLTVFAPATNAGNIAPYAKFDGWLVTLR